MTEDSALVSHVRTGGAFRRLLRQKFEFTV